MSQADEYEAFLMSLNVPKSKNCVETLYSFPNVAVDCGTLNCEVWGKRKRGLEYCKFAFKPVFGSDLCFTFHWPKISHKTPSFTSGETEKGVMMSPLL